MVEWRVDRLVTFLLYTTVMDTRTSTDIQADIRQRRARLDARIDELARHLDSAARRQRRISDLASTAIRSLEIVGGARMLWKQPLPFSFGKTALAIAWGVVQLWKSRRT